MTFETSSYIIIEVHKRDLNHYQPIVILAFLDNHQYEEMIRLH